jgi:hypothetical protein
MLVTSMDIGSFALFIVSWWKPRWDSIGHPTKAVLNRHKLLRYIRLRFAIRRRLREFNGRPPGSGKTEFEYDCLTLILITFPGRRVVCFCCQSRGGWRVNGR